MGLYVAVPLCFLFISPSRASESGKTFLLTRSGVLPPASCLSSHFLLYSSISLDVPPTSLHPMTSLRDSAHFALFLPLVSSWLLLKGATLGSPIILSLVTEGPLASREAPRVTQPSSLATVVQPGYPAHRRIVEAFGTEVLLENGDINRKVLGDLIFNQPDRRHLLNTITHPEIRKEMMKETFKYFLRGETQGLGQVWAQPSPARARARALRLCRKVGGGGRGWMSRL